MSQSEGKEVPESALAPQPAGPRRWWRTLAGCAVAIMCLWWALRHLDLGQLRRQLVAMNIYWVLAAILFEVLSYVYQGLRWKLLLRPIGKVPVLRTTQAIYAGLFVNELLPVKVGELVRAFLISRWTSVKLTSVAPSILLERLCDGVWLAVGIAIIIVLVPLPRRLVDAGDVFAVAILVALIVVALLAIAGRPRSNGSSHENSVKALLESIAFELRVNIRTRGALLAFALSSMMLLLQGLSFWLVMLAYHLHLTLLMGLAVFIIVHLGTLLPGAPANIGSYQFFTVLGLTLFGVEKSTAAGFSLVVFTVLTVPLLVLGLWALGSSGLTLREIRLELGTRLTSSRLRKYFSN